MPHRPPLPFTAAFIGITLLEIWGESLLDPWLHYTAKPLIMLSLMGWVLSRQSWAVMPSSLRWLLVGMAFALAGDVFLMLRSGNWFVAGLGAFLVMQLCYIRAFYLSIREGQGMVSRNRLSEALFYFGFYGGLFLYYAKPYLARNPAYAGLWLPVFIYVVCICTMGVMATVRKRAVRPMSHWAVMTGAILFVASDSLIALNKFVQPIPFATFLIMITYAAAQYLIATGMMASSIPANSPESQPTFTQKTL